MIKFYDDVMVCKLADTLYWGMSEEDLADDWCIAHQMYAQILGWA